MKVKVMKPTIKSQREALLKARAAAAHKKWLQNKAYQYDPVSGLFSTYEKTDSWVYKKENYLAEKLQKKLEAVREIEDIRIEMEHHRQLEHKLAEGRDRLAKTKDDAKLSAIKEFVTVRESLQMATTLQEVVKVHEKFLPRRIQPQHTQHTTHQNSTSSSYTNTNSPSSTQPTVLQQLLPKRSHTLSTSSPNSAASLETNISPNSLSSKERTEVAKSENRTNLKNSSSQTANNLLDNDKIHRDGITAAGGKASDANLFANSTRSCSTSAPASPTRSQQSSSVRNTHTVSVKQVNKFIHETQDHSPTIENIENKLIKRGYLDKNTQLLGHLNVPVTDSLHGAKQALENERSRLQALITRVSAGRRRDRDRVLEQVQQHHNRTQNHQEIVPKRNVKSIFRAKKNSPSKTSVESTPQSLRQTKEDAEKEKSNEALKGLRNRKVTVSSERHSITVGKKELVNFNATEIQVASKKMECASTSAARPSSSSSVLSACSSTSCAEFPILRHSLLTESDLPRLPPDTRFDDFFLIDDEYREKGGEEGSDDEALEALAQEGDDEYAAIYDDDFVDDCDDDQPALEAIDDGTHHRDGVVFSNNSHLLESAPKYENVVNEVLSQGSNRDSRSNSIVERSSTDLNIVNNITDEDGVLGKNRDQRLYHNGIMQSKVVESQEERNQDLEGDLDYEQDFDDVFEVEDGVEIDVAQTHLNKTEESIEKQNDETSKAQFIQNYDCLVESKGYSSEINASTSTSSRSDKSTRSHPSRCKPQSSNKDSTSLQADSAKVVIDKRPSKHLVDSDEIPNDDDNFDQADDVTLSSSKHMTSVNGQNALEEPPDSKSEFDSTSELKSNCCSATDLLSRLQPKSRASLPISSVQAVLLSARETIRVSDSNSGIDTRAVIDTIANESSSGSSTESTHSASNTGNSGLPSTNNSMNNTTLAPAIIGGYLPSLRRIGDRTAIVHRRLLNKSRLTNNPLPAS